MTVARWQCGFESSSLLPPKLKLAQWWRKGKNWACQRISLVPIALSISPFGLSISSVFFCVLTRNQKFSDCRFSMISYLLRAQLKVLVETCQSEINSILQSVWGIYAGTFNHNAIQHSSVSLK